MRCCSPSSATTWASAAITASPTSRTSSASTSRPTRPRGVLFCASALALALGYLICRADRRLEIRQGAGRRPRRREPHALPRLPRREVQARRLGALGLHGRHRRRALRAAGRHHQSRASSRPPIRSRWSSGCAVGGRGTLVGPIVGALLVNFAKTWFTSGALAPYWLFVLGGLFVAVTLFLPKGIVGTLAGLVRRERRANPPAAEAPAPNPRRPPTWWKTPCQSGGVRR